MVKVKLNRNHIDNISGDEIEIPDEQVNYFESVGLIGQGSAQTSPPVNKVAKQKRKTKQEKANFKTK